jgi:hypothetical protein
MIDNLMVKYAYTELHVTNATSVLIQSIVLPHHAPSKTDFTRKKIRSICS